MALQGVRNMIRILLHPFRKSLRYKLMLMMVAIAVLPLSLVTLFAAATTKQSLSAEVIRSNESRINWAGIYFDEKFNQLQTITYSLLLDNNLFPTANGPSNSDGYSPIDVLDSYIKEKLRALYIANNNQITQFTLYMKSMQRLYIVDKDAVRTTDQLNTPTLDWRTMEHSFESFTLIRNANHNVFTYARSMNRFQDREVLGGVSIDVRWKMMNSVLDMLHTEPNSQVIIADAKGDLIYDPYDISERVAIEKSDMERAFASPKGQGFIRTKQGFLFYRPVVSGQMWLIKFIPFSYVTAGASSTVNFSFVTAVIFIVLAIVVSILMAYFTTKPIIRLTKSMKALEFQNFDVGVSEIRSDEIGTLERRFNSMLHRIKELIQVEYKSKIDKRTAQLKAMQAQINPHFLNNALQVIGGIALSRKEPEIYEHIRAISDLFRYAIKMKSDIVSIDDEIEHVSNYLHIQKLRFQHMLNIQLEIDEECRSCQIPKFSLQPIVENCFLHGLEGKMGKWSIVIQAQRILDEVEISIKDNGIGIDEERLQQIRKYLNQESEESSFGDSMGLGNVNSRIKIIFGEEYGLFVTSGTGAGTTVKLVIPALPRQ
jgi:two-component system sensor histidine kinase YesM